MLDPWPIIQNIDNKAYELALFDYMLSAGITSVFYLSLLRFAPSADAAYLDQYENPQKFIVIMNTDINEKHQKWVVREIVNCRETRQGMQYKALFENN